MVPVVPEVLHIARKLDMMLAKKTMVSLSNITIKGASCGCLPLEQEGRRPKYQYVIGKEGL